MSTPNTNKGRGVLPVSVTTTKKTGKPPQRTTPQPKLRLIIRRLPPGLTEQEFWTALGTDWQAGNGKTEWSAFRAGKISKDLAKPSRPARAYLRLKDPSLLDTLAAKVKNTNFQDAKNTNRDPCLIGPPSLEFSPYAKSLHGRTRHDGRTGTIDQDSEFIDFLHSLTEPITKPTNTDEVGGKQGKVTTTPLIEYLKEKKANKAKDKEAVVSKTPKKVTDSKDVKTAAAPKEEPKSKAAVGATVEVEKARVAKATRDTVKAINKSVASMQGQQPSAKSDGAASATTTATTTQPVTRRRGNASVAAKIIGRDLGLLPKEPRTPRGSRAVSSATPATSTNSRTPTQTSSDSQPGNTPSSAQPPTGPRRLQNTTVQQATSNRVSSAPSPASRAPRSTPQPSPGAKSAFLKHANPSQGVTEDLLRSTFSVFGAISRCEIDKKKGLGYIDFTESEGLKNAMAASPVKIGNGNVVVMENKSPYTKKPTQPTAGKATDESTGSAIVTPISTTATATSVSEVVAATTTLASPPVTVSQPATSPSTPRANSRGGGVRGGNRGARGGGHRGRGGQSRGGKGGNAAAAASTANTNTSSPSTVV